MARRRGEASLNAGGAPSGTAQYDRCAPCLAKDRGREALRTRDGLFTGYTGSPSLPPYLGGLLFDWFFTTRSENTQYTRQIRSSGGVAVLVGEASDPPHWTAVGQACQRFLLQATALGMRVAFVNQPVEVPAVRSQLGAWLGIQPLRPDLVIRVRQLHLRAGGK